MKLDPTLPLLAAALLAAPTFAQGLEDAPFAGTPSLQEPDGSHELDSGSAPAAALGRALSIRDLLTAPLVDTDAEGTVWTRGRDHRASFGPDGFTFLPVFGKRSPQEWPVRFGLRAVEQGGLAAGHALTGGPSLDGTTVTLPREGFDEVYHLGLDGIEQTFRFDRLPGGEGDLVLDLSVETELFVDAGGHQLAFVHPEFGGVTYGEAFAYDAAGRRTAVARHWDGDGIELIVPAAFAATAELPLVVDPVLSTFVNGFGVSDDARPDAIHCGLSHEYLMVWEEYTSDINSDVYATTFDATVTTQGPAIGIEIGDDTWVAPRVGYSRAADTALVAASVNPEGYPGPSSSVRGRIVDMGTFSTPNADFAISSTGVPKRSVDVGGSTQLAVGSSHFLVTWSREMAPGDSDIEYRVLESDGAPVTGIINLDTSSVNDITPVVSDGQGNTNLNGDFWTVAWIRDDGTNGRGEVWARRVVWSGDPALGAGNFLVDGSTWNANPSVTCLFDEPLLGTQSRPSVVVFDRLYSDPDHPTGNRRAVIGRVITEDAAGPQVNFGGAQEDFSSDLDRFRPSVATDGRGFVLTYLEEKWSAMGSSDYDVYMLSGTIVDINGDARFALGERHVALDASNMTEYAPRVTMVAAGEYLNSSDDGLVVWYRLAGINTFGQVRGARIDDGAVFPSSRTVGVQYCDANPNSIPDYGGQVSTWLSLWGDGSVGSVHLANATDVPPNVFGYLTVSQNTGNVDLVGGSMGRLCLSGGIGRYTSQLQSSGGAGQFQTQIDPMSLPTAGGPVSAVPGQSWYFQYWHRDVVGGQNTSNFSNAVQVQFIP